MMKKRRVRQIAENAGIKESSLYNHFKNKADILETLFDEFITLAPQTRPSGEEIDFEKIRNPRAAEMYYEYVVKEPADYYERLINKIIERKRVKPVEARIFAEQYNYVSISLTQEYVMAQYGLADVHSVVGTPDNRTDVRLTDADNPIFNLVGLLLIHGLLLLIKLLNGLEVPFLFLIKLTVPVHV